MGEVITVIIVLLLVILAGCIYIFLRSIGVFGIHVDIISKTINGEHKFHIIAWSKGDNVCEIFIPASSSLEDIKQHMKKVYDESLKEVLRYMLIV